MGSTLASVKARVDASWVVAGLAVGDVAVVLAFVAVGLQTHGYEPLANLARVGETAIPFVVGWVLVAVVGGIYTRDAVTSPRRALSWTLPAWIVTVLLAQLLRATPLFHGNASLTFALVSVGVGGTMVVGWRVLASLALGRMA